MSITSAIKTLSTVPPPPAASTADISLMAADILAGRKPRNLVNGLKAIYSRIVAVETQLGMATTGFSLRPAILATRLVELEALAAQRLAPAAPAMQPAPLAATPAVQVAPPAAPAAVATVEAAAGALVASLADFRRMNAATRAQFQQDGGALARADFEALPTAARMAHCRAGGKVVDNPGTVASRYAPGDTGARNEAPAPATGIKSRADFEKLPAKAKMEFMRSGGRLTD